ncbi:MAG: ATP-dependent helicase [Planctomycetota bacterium]|nr:ATP-dependent helicase [Planctomycetota bacterium]
MAWHDGLTGRALEIAGTANSPIRVMAGPGTGKSFALKRRLTRLLEEGVNPKNVLVVTFTRNAAADLVQEIAALGVDGCEDIVASTLHSYCFRLLMKEAVFEFSGRTPRPLISISKAGVLQFEAAPLLEDMNAPDRFGNKRERTQRIRAFEAQWARLQSDDPGWAVDPVDAEFHEVLASWLQFHECMLIGELVPESLNFVRSNPLSAAIDQFDHVLVDEYQDLNKAEQVLIDHLAEHGSLGIVGDIDQSIYSFRYAHPDGIEEFNATHADTDDHVLDECRRCPQAVVAIADHVIRRNHPPAAGQRLNPMPGNPDGDLHVVQWNSMTDEVGGLASVVESLIEEQGYEAGEILILCPRRLIGYAIREKLDEAKIPVHSFYHDEALDEDKAQEAFSLLSLLANPKDRVSLRFLLGCNSQSWLAKQYRLIRDHCEESGKHPWDALEELVVGDLDLGRTGEIEARFTIIKEAIENIATLPVKELIDALFPEDDEWAEVLREMSILSMDDLDGSGELLNHLRTKITQPEMPEAGEFVRIMSLHKSKGLTSKAVIVCGCIEGLVPFRDEKLPPAEKARMLKEQRRLFYVAITRCTQFLAVSSFRRIETKAAFRIGAKTSGRGRVVSTVASQFLGELGPAAPAAMAGDDLLASM